MKKILKIFLYILVSVLIFVTGYFLGVTSIKKSEVKNDQKVMSLRITQDLLDISNLYGNILSLSEQKYQAVLIGDLEGAESLNEQIYYIISQINKLLEKYSSSVNTESY